MQYDLTEMKKRYGNLTAEEAVELVKKLNDDMISRGEELVGLLWYLEKSGLYKQYNGYKKLPFKVFVWEACHIPYNRYRELAYAYNWFPVEAREIGPTVIQTVRNKVGVVKIPMVLGEIKKAIVNIKDPGKRREAMFNVIAKHIPASKKRVKASEDTKAYWRKKYEDEHALRLKEKAAFEKEISELEARLAKQEGPVRLYLAMKDAYKSALQEASV